MSITFIPGGITAADGFTAAGIHCGIRKNKTKRDLALILADRPCAAGVVYTTNRVKAAPILLTMDHMRDGYARGILANSGNANACAPNGMEAAKQMAAAVAAETGLNPTDFIINSTGVIGQKLPVECIITAMPNLVKSLSVDAAPAAEAIMTTDTFPKSTAVRVKIGSVPITIGGIAKGSGMIHPNMATMFAFLTTDCHITPALLQEALRESVNRTYNRISVDGDTSTNDMTAILANGAAGNTLIDKKGEDYDTFLAALNAVNLHLAKEIARDGEGAKRLIIANVSGAEDEDKAVTIAKSVISSSLVKAAMFGADANWGRVICAMGYSGAAFDPTRVHIGFASARGSIRVCENGAGLPFDEALAKQILTQNEVTINIELNEGVAAAEAYGCDLTYDYVKINGDYRS